MDKEVAKSIARVVAMKMVKEKASDFDSLAPAEWLSGELPGLDTEEFQLVEKYLDTYLKVANVEVFFPEWQISEDGKPMTPEEAEEYHQGKASGPIF